MTNEEYQLATNKYAVYPKDAAPIYLILGLASEAGEVAGKLKKLLRGDYGVGASDVAIEAAMKDIRSEIGDCLWYISQWCNESNLSLSSLMEENISKLKDRADRNVIKGSGDVR